MDLRASNLALFRLGQYTSVACVLPNRPYFNKKSGPKYKKYSQHWCIVLQFMQKLVLGLEINRFCCSGLVGQWTGLYCKSMKV